jgi:protein-S-isoprenylcysteine O-methyltransferase Ste14
VLGQVLLFASGGLFAYLVVLGITVNVFVHTYEEPTLREAYGPSYDEFCENVPRWLPRLTAWRGATRSSGDRLSA